jgi:hypothetical protein
MNWSLDPVTTKHPVERFKKVVRPEPGIGAPDQSVEQPSDLAWDIVDEWGEQSFPVSDPPSNW